MNWYPYEYSSDRRSPYPPSPYGQHPHRSSVHERPHHRRPTHPERRRRISLPTHSWLDGSSHAGTSDGDISRLMDRHLAQPKDLGLSEDEAVKLAVDALKGYERTRIEALSDPDAHDRYPREMLPFQIFPELDQEMFRGVLNKAIHLRWSELEQGMHGATSRAGRNGISRVTIELNRKFLDRGSDHRWSREALIAALLHHMTHAYFLICCGFRNEEAPGEKYDLRHNNAFCTLLYQVQNSLKLRSGPRLPSLFNCTSYPGLKRARIDVNHKHIAGTSYCLFNLDETVPIVACEEYLKKIRTVKQKQGSGKESESKPQERIPCPIDSHVFLIDYQTLIAKPFHRTEYKRHHTEYVELHFHGQAYPVSRSSIISHPSLRAKLLQTQASLGSAQFIPIPASSFEEFISLVQFVEKGDYAPDMSEHLSQSRGTRGPPKILEFKRDCRPYLVTDIRAYSIAKKVGFEELKKRALERLYLQAFTHNDPMEALEEIYGRLDKDARDGDLRSWVKRWLLVERSSGTMIETNIEYLAKDPQWKDKLAKLRGRGGDFLEDIDCVQNDLMRQRGYPGSVTSFLSGSSTVGSMSGSYGGSMAGSYAPTRMPSPQFHDSIPIRNYNVQSGSQTPNQFYHQVYQPWTAGRDPYNR